MTHVRRGDDGARRTPNPNAEARTPGERPCMQLAGFQGNSEHTTADFQ